MKVAASPTSRKPGPAKRRAPYCEASHAPGRTFQRRFADHARQVTRLADLGGVARRQHSGMIGLGRPRIDHHRQVAPPARHRHRPRPAVGVRLDHGVRVVPGRLSAVDRHAFETRPRVVAPPDAHQRQRCRAGVHARTMAARHHPRAPGAVENRARRGRHRPAALIPAGDHQLAARVVTAGNRREGRCPPVSPHPAPSRRSARPRRRAAPRPVAAGRSPAVAPDARPGRRRTSPPAANRRPSRPYCRLRRETAPTRSLRGHRPPRTPSAARGQRLGERRRRGVGLRQQQDGVPPGREQAPRRSAGGAAADDRHVDRLVQFPPILFCHPASPDVRRYRILQRAHNAGWAMRRVEGA